MCLPVPRIGFARSRSPLGAWAEPGAAERRRALSSSAVALRCLGWPSWAGSSNPVRAMKHQSRFRDGPAAFRRQPSIVAKTRQHFVPVDSQRSFATAIDRWFVDSCSYEFLEWESRQSDRSGNPSSAIQLSCCVPRPLVRVVLRRKCPSPSGKCTTASPGGGTRKGSSGSGAAA
jgi:hypothetical protein